MYSTFAILFSLAAIATHVSGGPLPEFLHPQHALFTAAGYQYPCPPNSTLPYCENQITGTPMTAKDGVFYINPKAAPSKNPTVLYVDLWGQAFLDSAHSQQIYLNTATGALSYLNSTSHFPPSALLAIFQHLGHGTDVVEGPGYPGPSSFTCKVGSNDSWFFCPIFDANFFTIGYQVFRNVGGDQFGGCLSAMGLAALDYSGKSPAVGEY